MKRFELDNIPAQIKPGGSKWLAAATQPRGDEGKPTQITEHEIHFILNMDDCEDQVEFLFANAKQFCQMVAGEEHNKGEDRTARTKLPEMNITILYKNGVVFSQKNVTVKARPQLRVGHKGDAHLVIKPRLKFTDAELAKVAGLIGADTRVSMEPTQVDHSELGEGVTPETAKPKTKTRGAKAVAEKKTIATADGGQASIN